MTDLNPVADAPARDAATTPVIPGFFPDPSVCRVGEDYYLVNSTFEYTPGIPIWHSRDLLSWTQLGNVLTRDSQYPSGSSPASRGIYAPTLRHRDGVFFVVVTNVEREHEQFVVTATDPAGPWSEPIAFPGLYGIDPDLSWDQDGACYLTYCSHEPSLVEPGAKLPVIAQARIDLERGVRLEEPRVIWDGTGLAHPEGPHLYLHEGWWYLLIAEGGTERGHAVCIARSRSIEGPFESAPTNPIFSRRSTGFPVQNTGHPDFVLRPDGSWAMLYLGVRPRGLTPSFHVNGRETFLARVEWVDGWPVIHADDVLPAPADTAFRDDFVTPDLHPRYVSPGAAPSAFATRHPEGGVELVKRDADNGAPSALSVRTRNLRWRYEARVSATGGDVGLRVRMDERHWYEVQLAGRQVRAVAQVGPFFSATDALSVRGEVVTLVVEAVEAAEGGPDDLRLGVLDDDGERCLATWDGRYLSTEVGWGFTGRTLGLHALGTQPAHVLEVAYVPLGDD